MKRPALITALYALLGTPILLAQLGCLDNSWHLKQKYDHKTYHEVACNCPCDAYKAKGLWSQNRNQCLECGHFHVPKPIIFIKKVVSGMKGIRLPDTPKEALEQLMAHWKRTVQ